MCRNLGGGWSESYNAAHRQLQLRTSRKTSKGMLIIPLSFPASVPVGTSPLVSRTGLGLDNSAALGFSRVDHRP